MQVGAIELLFVLLHSCFCTKHITFVPTKTRLVDFDHAHENLARFKSVLRVDDVAKFHDVPDCFVPRLGESQRCYRHHLFASPWASLRSRTHVRTRLRVLNVHLQVLPSLSAKEKSLGRDLNPRPIDNLLGNVCVPTYRCIRRIVASQLQVNRSSRLSHRGA